MIKKELTIAQNRMKQLVDSRSERTFEVGDMVYLKVKRFQQQLFSLTPTLKLSSKYYGPFPILAKIGKVAYRLQLLEGVKIHPVFHVSLLKKSMGPMELTSLDLLHMEEDASTKVEPLAVLEKSHPPKFFTPHSSLGAVESLAP